MIMIIVLLIISILEATLAFSDSSCWDEITVTFAVFLFFYVFIYFMDFTLV